MTPQQLQSLQVSKDRVANKYGYANWAGFLSSMKDKEDKELLDNLESESNFLFVQTEMNGNINNKQNEINKLNTELKDGDETLSAKLRNALSPHYGLPSVILKLREHLEILKIVEDMAEQALKNNFRIDALLNAIDSSPPPKEGGREVEFAEWLHNERWQRHTDYKDNSLCMFRTFSHQDNEIKSISELFKIFLKQPTLIQQ